eukprot:358605-Chlamydomonas_euryale.AAC.11
MLRCVSYSTVALLCAGAFAGVGLAQASVLACMPACMCAVHTRRHACILPGAKDRTHGEAYRHVSMLHGSPDCHACMHACLLVGFHAKGRGERTYRGVW